MVVVVINGGCNLVKAVQHLYYGGFTEVLNEKGVDNKEEM